MTNAIHMALIGCGGMGRSHMARAREVPELSVVAYVDAVEGAARQTHADFRGRYYATDAKRVMHDDGIDAVLIATHHDSHTPLAIQAAQAGKHIFLEKPMALTMAECFAIEEAVARAGVKLMMGFKFRFAPLVSKVKEVVKKPLVTVGQSLHPAMQGWPLTADKGGGPVLSNGCHAFDLVYWLNESEPVLITATGGSLTHPELRLIDNAAVSIQFANGSIGAIIAGDSGDARYTSKFFFEVLDGQRTATLYDRCHKASFWGWERDSLTVEELSPAAQSDPEGARAELQAFAHCLLNNTEPPTGPRDGTRATAMVLCAFEAIRTGKAQAYMTGKPSRWALFRREWKRGEARWGYIFAALTLLPILTFSIVPMASVFYFAFTDYSIFGRTTDWIGLENFREALEGDLFFAAVRNTFQFTIFSVPVRLALGFFIALLLNRKFAGISLIRAVYYIPGLTSTVAIAVVWMWLFDPKLGMANVALNLVGLGAQNWLRDPDTALGALVVVSVWSGFGVTMIIYLAGLQGIPTMYYEAAQIDGANGAQLLRHITWPLLRPVTFYLFVTGVIGAMQVFTLVLVMTQGGPLDRTTTLVHQIYLNAISFNRMGYASALSLVLFVMILILTLINLKFFAAEIEF